MVSLLGHAFSVNNESIIVLCCGVLVRLAGTCLVLQGPASFCRAQLCLAGPWSVL